MKPLYEITADRKRVPKGALAEMLLKHNFQKLTSRKVFVADGVEVIYRYDKWWDYDFGSVPEARISISAEENQSSIERAHDIYAKLSDRFRLTAYLDTRFVG
jgi:hypothetical protein